jgi:hypothetical protein
MKILGCLGNLLEFQRGGFQEWSRAGVFKRLWEEELPPVVEEAVRR